MSRSVSCLRLLAGAAGLLWALPADDRAATAAEPISSQDFFANLSTERAEAHVGQPGNAVGSVRDFEEMRQHLLRLYSGISPTHSVRSERQIFDCVPILNQPGVREAGLPTVAAPPPSPPSVGGTAASPSRLAAPLCEEGTIPMRRVTLAELTRFKILRDFIGKGPNGAGRLPSAIRSGAPASIDGHSYSITYQWVNVLGGQTTLNVWTPYIRTDLNEVFSISQQWYAGGSGAGTQTAEAGWQVYPAKYGTEQPMLFTYWTADNYQTTGCYNLDCGAFIQVNGSYALGGPLSASTIGGTQSEISLQYYLTQGNWWIGVNGTWIGYYPGYIYRGGQMTYYAQLIEFGGETYGLVEWPPMGSGNFATGGYGSAAYQRLVAYYDLNSSPWWAASMAVYQTAPSCYMVTSPQLAAGNGAYFFFGGPGGYFC